MNKYLKKKNKEIAKGQFDNNVVFKIIILSSVVKIISFYREVVKRLLKFIFKIVVSFKMNCICLVSLTVQVL